MQSGSGFVPLIAETLAECRQKRSISSRAQSRVRDLHSLVSQGHCSWVHIVRTLWLKICNFDAVEKTESKKMAVQDAVSPEGCRRSEGTLL